MKFFDTNVFVTAMLPKREFHDRAQTAFATARSKGEACISTHNLAEIYNVLTGRVLIDPVQAKQLMDLNLHDVEIISITTNHCQIALARVSSLGISGGVIFDAILAECAVQHQCDTLYTFNLKHFTRLGADITAIAREP
jgi:predicted nucleic acid-binding protein